MNVVIIGAGVVGLASGWELARRGCDVVIVERDEPGAGASTAAAGMLAPVAEAKFQENSLLRLCLESLERWPAFAADLEAAADLSIDFRTDGTLVVAVDRDDLESLTHQHRLHTELGLSSRMIDGGEARELEPTLAPGVPGAVHCPNDHQVDPLLLVRALIAAFEAEGGRVVAGVDVRGLRREGPRIVGLDCDGFEAPHDATYVLATGAWARKMAGLGTDVPHVRPALGQMLSVDLGEPPLCRHVIRTPDAYLVPKSDGRLVIGATMEERGFDARITAGGIMDLLVGAWEVLPAVYDQALLDTWSGFRPMTLDNEPVMRRSSDVENLVYAVGHGRGGILLTPLTGTRVADMVAR